MKTYQSEFAPGQSVWLMRDNKAVCLPIGSVKITSVVDAMCAPIHETTMYGIRTYDEKNKFKEWKEYTASEVFATKEALLASL